MNKSDFLKNKMRIIEDFPAKGISYKDITTILEDKEAFNTMVELLEEEVKDMDFDYIMGVDARGFILGAALCQKMNKGFLMARKPGKLPGNLIKEEYDLEYGKAAVELDVDSVKDGSKIVIIDDLLATGGTAKAVCNLATKAGGEVVCALFLTELEDIGGKKVLENAGYKVKSILKWAH